MTCERQKKYRVFFWGGGEGDLRGGGREQVCRSRSWKACVGNGAIRFIVVVVALQESMLQSVKNNVMQFRS